MEKQVVWVVQTCYPYDGCVLEGIFSSRDLAEAYIGAAESYKRPDMETAAWFLDDPDTEVPGEGDQ